MFEDSNLLEYDAVSLGLWFRIFRTNVIPLPSSVVCSKIFLDDKCVTFLKLQKHNRCCTQ